MLTILKASLWFLTATAIVLGSDVVSAETILFDASRHEMAGNADWVIDADLFNLNLPAYPCSGSSNESRPQRTPTPPQSGITGSTPESYWTGAISAWAIDLVKAGHTVETLPDGAAITFGDGSNPQDLSHYRLFIVVEPQIPFTAAEKSAILAFVASGGGLFMVADHETSDRDCDGWDAPAIWNDLSGATSAGATGLFGIWFRVDGVENQGSEDWFDDAVDANTATDPSDPIIHGPFGSGAGGLGLFGSTSMELRPADNSGVRAHVWRTGQPHDGSRVTFATSLYGAGRVAAIGDSSPADDNTGDPSDSLHPGWNLATGGVNNREIHLNACAWLLNPPPDTVPPAQVTDLTAVPISAGAIRIAWTASGDDGNAGLAAAYDLRISPRPILTAADFAGAEPVAGAPSPQAAGSSELFDVAGLPADTPAYFALVVIDEASNRSEISNSDGAVTAPSSGGPPQATHLVISQLQVAGDGGTPADDEFVELYNPTASGIPLGGLSIQYKSATGSTYLPVPLPALTLPSHGWYLIARSAYTGPVAADLTNTTFQMSASGGNLFLVGGSAALPSSSCSTAASIIDKLGYGTGNCAESSPPPAAPAANGSLARKPGGSLGSGFDSDNNAADFDLLAVAVPHNGSSPPATPRASLGNVGPTLYLTKAPVDVADLDWANAAGATAYRIYRGTVPGFMSGGPAPWSTTGTSRISDPDLPTPPGAAWFYLVRATDGAAESQN
jgi:hypothetical protein